MRPSPRRPEPPRPLPLDLEEARRAFRREHVAHVDRALREALLADRGDVVAAATRDELTRIAERVDRAVLAYRAGMVTAAFVVEAIATARRRLLDVSASHMGGAS